MSGRNAQVARIYTILDLLEASLHGLTVADIWEKVHARGHDVSKRTIYRDLEALSSAGFPLFPEGEREQAQWRLERQTRVTQYLVLSARELFALYLAREALTPLQKTVFYKDLVEAFAKIEAKFGKSSRQYFDSLRGEVRFEPLPKWGFGLDPELVDTVRAAAAEGHVLEVFYRSVNAGGTERRRHLGAQFLYFAKGGIYLIAEDLESNEVKVFSLARMRDALMTDQVYNGPAVDPEKFFEFSIGVFRGKQAEKVELLFTSPITTHIRERHWHSSQQTVLLANGKVRLTLEVAITPELLQWILGYGAHVEVLGPAKLRAQVVQAAKQMLEHYKKKRISA